MVFLFHYSSAPYLRHHQAITMPWILNTRKSKYDSKKKNKKMREDKRLPFPRETVQNIAGVLRRAAQELTDGVQQEPDMLRRATQELIRGVQQPNHSAANPTLC